MSEKPNYRLERIERLLKELEYEVVRGMMDREIEDETMGFEFYVPISNQIKDGVVHCSFRTRPIPSHMMVIGQPRLKLVKSDKN